MEIPRHWRLKQQRYGLVGEVFVNSGRTDLMGRPVDLGYVPGEVVIKEVPINVTEELEQAKIVVTNDLAESGD